MNTYRFYIKTTPKDRCESMLEMMGALAHLLDRYKKIEFDFHSTSENDLYFIDGTFWLTFTKIITALATTALDKAMEAFKENQGLIESIFE